VPQRKTRRAGLRAGFQAGQISSIKTPGLSGPVKRFSDDLSTGGINQHARQGQEAEHTMAAIARLDRANQFSRALMLDREALE
jgi:hypothetical protein